MTRDEIRKIVVQAVSDHGCQLDIADITDETAMVRFGGIVDVIPWARFSDHRASFYGCAVFAVPFWFLWRLLMWPVNREVMPKPDGTTARLTVGHLTDVVERGHWFEPVEREP